MGKIEKFVHRLKKLNIDVTFVGNYPWIYLDTVNGKKVTEKNGARHGFNAFLLPPKFPSEPKFVNSKNVFRKIREMIDVKSSTNGR